MELQEGTSVYSADGDEIGKVNRFVINPVSKKVTHFVVQKGLLFPEDKVIPMDWVASAQEERIMLRAKADEVKDLPPFEEVHFVELDETERQSLAAAPYAYNPSYYWYPPFGAPSYAYPYIHSDVAAETERNIPKNTVPLMEGADVISADGEHIGDVERVFMEAEGNRATHFLISQGLFLKEHKLVPVDWVTTMIENKVHLAVSSKFVDKLPEFQE